MFRVRFHYFDSGFVTSFTRLLFSFCGRHLVDCVREQCFFAATPRLLIVALSPPTERSLVRAIDSPFSLVIFVQTGVFRLKAELFYIFLQGSDMANKRPRTDPNHGAGALFDSLADSLAGKLFASAEAIQLATKHLQCERLRRDPTVAVVTELLQNVVAELRGTERQVPGRLLAAREDLHTAE